MSDPRPIPRTVKPRRKETNYFPLIAIDEHSFIVERTGEILPLADLPFRLRTEPASILVCQGFSVMLSFLNDELEHDPSWQYRVSPVKRAIFSAQRPDRGHRITTLDTVCAFCGFRPPEGSKKKGHYHFPLDPMLFSRTPIDTLMPGDAPRLFKLFEWGKDVREWAGTNNLRISATVGGIASQLLRDERFYGVARRKVPGATNARARIVLPGNYYRLYAKPNRTYAHAQYLDMKSAHHWCAAAITFPHADKLQARGRFRVTDETLRTAIDGKPWRGQGERAYHRLLESHGLFLLHLTVPPIPTDRFPPPYMETPGRKLAWVFSNELPFIRSLGGIIDGIEASWTSFQTDTGLNRYAEWALAETAFMETMRKRWAKPVLLSTYGILASRPRTMSFGFRRAKGGELRWLPAGPTRIPAFLKETLTEQELGITNVIHRGMIEAECRTQALIMARSLTDYGVTVHSIYADAIFTDTAPLPLLPPPWIVKGTLTRLLFFNATAFASVEETRLPGIPREGLDRLRHLERMRRG